MSTAQAQKRDIQQEVTDRIVAAMESAEKSGETWVMPWNVHKVNPINGYTGKRYRGINIVSLGWAASYADPRWYTFNAVRSKGHGCVRKGSKGWPVVYYSIVEKSADNKRTDDTSVEKIPVMRYSTVFNHAQIDWAPGKEPKRHAPQEHNPLVTDEVLNNAEVEIMSKTCPVHWDRAKAFYSPTDDYIGMPPRISFVDSESRFATLAHEVAHSTGHKSRLDRKFGAKFGDDTYALEELTAELSSAMICSFFNVQSNKLDTQHATYLNSWIRVLKTDKRAIFTVASAAQKVVDWVLPSTVQTDADEEGEG